MSKNSCPWFSVYFLYENWQGVLNGDPYQRAPNSANPDTTFQQKMDPNNPLKKHIRPALDETGFYEYF